jgi:hypothetical protein
MSRVLKRLGSGNFAASSMEGRIWRVCDQPTRQGGLVGPAYLVGLDPLNDKVQSAVGRTRDVRVNVPELWFSPDGIEDQSRRG